MTVPAATPGGDERGRSDAIHAQREPEEPDRRARSDTTRYIMVIAAGLLVAGGALSAGLLLAMRGGSSGAGTVVGSGARTAPQTAITAPPAPSLAPDTPPAVMGDHVAGDPGAAYYVRAADQQGDGRSVVVEDVTFSQVIGWVVVHSDVGDAPGPILGVSSQQAAGHHVTVVVTLTAPVTVSSNLFVMLHTEDNGDATFDYPRSDQPAQLDGQIVMVPIYLRVQ